METGGTVHISSQPKQRAGGQDSRFWAVKPQDVKLQSTMLRHGNCCIGTRLSHHVTKVETCVPRVLAQVLHTYLNALN